MAALDDAADELASIARHLRFIGETALVAELTKGMRSAAEPVPARIREQMGPHLPNRYAAVLDADTRIGITVRTAETNPGVSVYATSRNTGKRRRLNRLDGGVLWHPVYGDMSVWREQAVTPGWFSGVAAEANPEVRAAIERALEDVSQIAAGKG